MSKCYYCGDSSRGCPECRKPVWNLIELLPANTPVVRVPIKADSVNLTGKSIETMVSELSEQIAQNRENEWLREVQSRVAALDSRITLEMVREVDPFKVVLLSRTVFEDQPVGAQNRIQQWPLDTLVKRGLFSNSKDSHGPVAKFVAEYWKLRRAVAVSKVHYP